MQLLENIILCGRYGVGKTSFAVSLAMEFAARGEKTVVADLDIVNPYFRTADFEKLFSEAGVGLIAPMYANTNLDIPVLPPGLRATIRDGAMLDTVYLCPALLRSFFCFQVRLRPVRTYWLSGFLMFMQQSNQRSAAQQT